MRRLRADRRCGHVHSARKIVSIEVIPYGEQKTNTFFHRRPKTARQRQGKSDARARRRAHSPRHAKRGGRAINAGLLLHRSKPAELPLLVASDTSPTAQHRENQGGGRCDRRTGCHKTSTASSLQRANRKRASPRWCWHTLSLDAPDPFRHRRSSPTMRIERRILPQKRIDLLMVFSR